MEDTYEITTTADHTLAQLRKSKKLKPKTHPLPPVKSTKDSPLPNIVFTKKPQIIYTDASQFRSVVQRLTGLSAKHSDGKTDQPKSEKYCRESKAYEDMFKCMSSLKMLDQSVNISQECLDCLVYCTLFPKDYEIDHDTLIQLWMAEGLIKEEPMEDIAASYLRALCEHKEYISFLKEDHYGTGKSWYKVHSLELPEQVLERSKITRVRETEHFHVTLQCFLNIDLQALGRFTNMRSLLLLRNHKAKNVDHIAYDLFMSLQNLPGMGALTGLHTLSEFIVGRENGCRIRELANMNELGGKLCLSKLENVANLNDAKEASLKYKQRLKNLELQWTDDEHQESIGVTNEVIKYLQPHTNLKGLRILCYRGSIFPSWISDPSFVNLTKLTLFKCASCQLLPSLGQLLSLESLSLIDMIGVRIIDFHFRRDEHIVVAAAAIDEDDQFVAFPALQKLEIKSMLNLEKWNNIGKLDFPCLRKLSIKDCPKLAALSELTNIRALEYLELNQCTKLQTLAEGEFAPSLKTLVVEDCPLLSLSYSMEVNQDWVQSQHSSNSFIYQRGKEAEEQGGILDRECSPIASSDLQTREEGYLHWGESSI
ncbi:hypothetical protein BVRB_3g063880 [Beta vulgaris subsp. vulgaris]|nr:hypothetical protein BVRB_3g063880 [Beta vulgaris subsp. vulgaris]